SPCRALERDSPRLHLVRRRRPRPGVRTGNGDARGRRPLDGGGARLPPHPARDPARRRRARARFSSPRPLREIQLVAADVVEVSPPYDGPGQQTALAAANVAYELLGLRALT